MNATTARPEPHPNPPDSPVLLQRAPSNGRPAMWLDYLIFFVGIPVAIAFIFSLVEIRLIAGMPYLDSFFYMILHMFIAWWSISLTAAGTKFVFRSWQPPVIAICCLGFFISLIPAAFLFQQLGEYYGSLYPSFAANRADAALPGWKLEYLLHFIRFSIPALPLFLAGVFGYRHFTGVDWFGYAAPAEAAPAEHVQPASQSTDFRKAVAGMIAGSKLPGDAEILAIKAEQHYIQIWSDQGTDMVRYRFKDLPNELAGCHGAQVHRSWWVNFQQVADHRLNGRNLELVINDELVIPVSLSFKNSALSMLKQKV